MRFLQFNTDKIKGFDSDIPTSIHKSYEEMAFFRNSILRGEHTKGDLEVFILDEVYEHIQRYAKTDLKKELSGVLLGKTIEKDGDEILVVSGVLDAKYTENIDQAPEYTQKTWSTIHSEREAFFTELEIIGWFHTCPESGIELSRSDTFVQNNFSDFLWKLAYLFDPISKEEGFYQRKTRDIIKCSGYFVYSKTKRLTQKTYSQTSNRKPTKSSSVHIRPKRKIKNIIQIINAILVILVITVMIGQFRLNSKYNSLVATNVETNVQEDKISKLEAKVEELESKYNELVRSGIVPSNTGSQGGESNDKTVQNEIPQQNNDYLEYVVQPGDTLWGISQNHFGDGQKHTLIMEINGIQDIRAGQIILLPVVE